MKHKDLQIYVCSSKTAMEAWENFVKHFQQKTFSKKIFYQRKPHPARIEKGQNMTVHVTYIKTLFENLQTIDDTIAERDLVILLISSLPEEYNYLITALETLAEGQLTWDYVRDRLIHESEKMKPKDDSEKVSDALLVSKPDKRNNKCHYCQKNGTTLAIVTKR